MQSDIIRTGEGFLMKYKLVVFDLDGTLVNSLEDLAIAVNYGLKKANLPLHNG